MPLAKFLPLLVLVSTNRLVNQLISVGVAFQFHIQRLYGSVKFLITHKINTISPIVVFVLKRGEEICPKSHSELPENQDLSQDLQNPMLVYSEGNCLGERGREAQEQFRSGLPSL